MSTLMDKAMFNSMPVGPMVNPLVQQYQQAMQNPSAFIEQIKRVNPQAYQRAMQLAQCSNPQMAVMQILQSRGLTPAMFNLPNI